MSCNLARTAFRTAPRLRTSPAHRRWASVAATYKEEQQHDKQAIKRGATRDPELIVLFVIMCGIYGVAGWHFARKPTASSDQRPVTKVPETEPWHDQGASHGKYKYAPHGDINEPRKEAPTALNSVVIPDVTLPKHLHERFNKIDKPNWGAA